MLRLYASALIRIRGLKDIHTQDYKVPNQDAKVGIWVLNLDKKPNYIAFWHNKGHDLIYSCQ